MPTWNALLSPLWLAALGAGLVLVLALLWWRFGSGPRRGRILRRLRQLLRDGHWPESLQQTERLRKKGVPRRWRKSFADLQADCLEQAVNKSLEDKDFDEALKLARQIADLRNQPEGAAEARVQAAMLEELRRQFAAGSARAVYELAEHPLLAPSREVAFWQALSYLREGQSDRAVEQLKMNNGRKQWTMDNRPATTVKPPLSIVNSPISIAIDPPLYLGALLLRRGQAKEALKLLTEANRIDGSCPVVTAQLGTAMIAAGADASFAVRTLSCALGPRGLAQWADKPDRVWIEAFPEHHSYIRKLAEKHPYVCPLWGGDLQLLIRQGKLALAQGLYRLGQYQEASDIFQKLLEEGAPSALVLRGLGISLAKLGKYDDAFKHLRIAHEMEEPKDRLTAGYLALCGARGKPSQPEAKIQNVVWAVQLVSHFNAPQDAEWAGIISELFAEARDHQIPLSLNDQLYLCEHLWSVHATDMRAAQAYHHVRLTYPQAVRPEYAWLFCRAVEQGPGIRSQESGVRSQESGVRSQGSGVRGQESEANSLTPDSWSLTPDPDLTLEMFALTFASEADARAFYKERQWDFDEMEVAYLTRTAELAPGSFPASLGPDYPALGQQILLARSQDQEKAGRMDQALATVDVLTCLAPANPLALDRLALLHHRLGQRDLALAALARWQTAHPHDPMPMIRQAVLLYQAEQFAEGHDKVSEALQHSQGRQKADIALLGARLALHQARLIAPNGATTFQPDALNSARAFLEEGVGECPDHLEALEFLVAVLWLLGDVPALASRAAGFVVRALARLEAGSSPHYEPGIARFHYFAGLCHWANRDQAGTLRACQLVGLATPVFQPNPSVARNGSLAADSHGKDRAKVVDLNLPLESSFLAGLAYHKAEDWPRAQTALEPVAQTAASPSAPLAQALLGGVCLAQEQPERAMHWWQTLDARKRAGWQLSEPLANTMFLSALTAFQEGRFEEAGERSRNAGKLGCRDRRLGPLLILSLFRAGQAAYYGNR